MKKFIVTGMSCAACSARVEKAVNKVEGVESCAVSLITNSMGVEGTADDAAIIKAVVEAGYGASVVSEARSDEAGYRDNPSISMESGDIQSASENYSYASENQADALTNGEEKLLRNRLLMSLAFVIVLMYISMGHVMWGWPVPGFFENNYLAIGLSELILSAIVMVINQKFFVSGFKGLMHGAPNMDTLVALGSGASFVYSVYVLFKMIGVYAEALTAMSATVFMTEEAMAAMRALDAAKHYMHDLYFESAAMILALITVGKMLEARSKGKTTDALRGLMKLAPKTAKVIRDGKEVEIPAIQVRKGDVFVVYPGDSVPVDGIVLEGNTAINEAALTGESIPVDKAVGDYVSAATINQSGFIKCEATRVGEDTTLSQIIKMVSDAAATKAPIAKVADKVSGVFVPVVITIAIITTIIWLFVGESFGYALARGISVLVISCPCALGLATPVAIMVGNGMGAKNGILFKTAVSLEETGKVKYVALDKTGTITNGEPKVTDLVVCNAANEEELLHRAYILERKSEHPLAKAIVNCWNDRNVRNTSVKCECDEPDTEDFTVLPGNGLSARLGNDELLAGNLKFISTKVKIDEDINNIAIKLADEGKTPLFFATNQKLDGIIAVADTIKEDSASAIEELKNMGIHVVMITGDNERTAKAIGEQAGVSEVIAGVLPDGKEEAIRELMSKGKVAMVGDGINDAPALTRADVGIAIGAGTDVAMDAADVVLVKSRLSDIPAAIRLSRATLRNIHQNLFWAFFYNTIGIPLAAGVFIKAFGWQLNPMFGAAAMSLSSFCVVSNALRLNLFKIRDDKHSRGNVDEVTAQNNLDNINNTDVTNNINETEKGNYVMEKTMRIEGMMCGHCSGRVKKVLEALSEVDEAVVSHEAGTAVLTLNSDIADSKLKEIVEAEGYKVLD